MQLVFNHVINFSAVFSCIKQISSGFFKGRMAYLHQLHELSSVFVELFQVDMLYSTCRFIILLFGIYCIINLSFMTFYLVLSITFTYFLYFSCDTDNFIKHNSSGYCKVRMSLHHLHK